MTQQGRGKLLQSILLGLLASHEYLDYFPLLLFVMFQCFLLVIHGLKISLQEDFRYVEGDYLSPLKDKLAIN